MFSSSFCNTLLDVCVKISQWNNSESISCFRISYNINHLTTRLIHDIAQASHQITLPENLRPPKPRKYSRGILIILSGSVDAFSLWGDFDNDWCHRYVESTHYNRTDIPKVPRRSDQESRIQYGIGMNRHIFRGHETLFARLGPICR